MCFETVWVEIFSETRRAWTCFFEYLELIFASFFLFFILKISIKCPCLIGFYLKECELIRKLDVLGKGIKFFGWINKPNQKIKKLFIQPKNLILFRLQVFIVFYWSNVMALFLLELFFCGHFMDLIFEDA